ncbi:unnamed protein product [Linum tenue]|uniref:Glabrous enhancer-binding protein-like DBD domain-containing protein n=1 Tax=Linum tenue TaxID=586396 RepID=A0AAV0M2J8_9ROSI|nr:unnamed protein product [Linum tenue]
MAAKRLNLKEDPPAPSSSEEDDENSSAHEASSDEELPPQGRKTLAPQSQGQPKKPAVQSSDSESGDDSDTDSDSDPPPKSSGILHNVKPIASKPQPKAQANAAPASSSKSTAATKRASETDRQAKDVKRQKEVAERDKDDDGKNEDVPRVPFQRLWGENDEIAVLSGLIEFAEKKGADPLKDMAAFYDFINKSLAVDVSLAQLKEKVARFRKKFKNHANGKNGLDKSFSKAHDQKSFDLSKKIWDSQGEGLLGRIADGKSNGKAKKSGGTNGGSSSKSASKAADLVAAKEQANAKRTGGGSSSGNANRNASNAALGAGNGGAEAMKINGANDQKDGLRLDWSPTGAEVESFVVKNELDMVEGSKRNELARRWKEHDIAALELFVQRNELIIEKAQLILDSTES